VAAEKPLEISQPEKWPKVLLAKPLQEMPREDALKKLQRGLYNARHEIARFHFNQFIGGTKTGEDFLDAAETLLRVGLDFYQAPKERIIFLEQMREVSEKVNAVVDLPGRRSRVSPLEGSKAKAFQLLVEIAILKEKRR
jgi:hypothetical protein